MIKICGIEDLAVSECASRVNAQPVASYPYFINAGKYIYFLLSLRVRLVCRFNLLYIIVYKFTIIKKGVVFYIDMW